MYKMVTGSVDELEGKLNEAAAAGFTEVAREFSSYETAPFHVDAEGNPLRPTLEHRPTYSYLLRKRERSPLSQMFEGMAGELLQILVTGVMSGSGIKVDVGDEPTESTPATSTSSAPAAA